MLKKPKHASAMTIPAAVIGSLVEYMDARLDAKAILLAIPHDELTAPLAALRRLMTAAKAFDGQWPMVQLRLVPDDYFQLVLVALPVIPKVQVNSVWGMEDHLRDSDLDAATVFAALAPKLTKMVYSDWLEKPTIWPMCTRLAHVYIHARYLAAALPLLPSSVCELTLYGRDCGPEDFAALSRWLKTGRVKRLVLFDFNSQTSAGAMAEMLATTTSVTSMAFVASDVLTRALAAARRPLWHFTDVEIIHLTSNDAWAGILVALLDLSKLTRLVAKDFGDLSWFVLLLKMPLLQELALRNITLTVSRATLSDVRLPSLRVLEIRNVQVGDASFDALVDWATQLPQLDDLHWHDMECEYSSRTLALVQQAIIKWTQTLSALSLRSCAFVKASIPCLAQSLRARSNDARPFVLDLRASDDQRAYHDSRVILGTDGIFVLLNALKGRANVMLKLSVDENDEAAVKAHARATRISMEVLKRNGTGFVESLFYAF